MLEAQNLTLVDDTNSTRCMERQLTLGMLSLQSVVLL
jgi:hypothetical protein